MSNLFRRLYSFWLELRLKVTGKPIPIQDWAGYRFWQYPGDRIKFNIMRKSVVDSVHIARYIHRNVTPGSVCVDIGANIGAITIPFWSRSIPGGKVISVEADPRNIPRIKANLRLNEYSDDHVVNVAIADRNDTMQLRCYPPGYNGWQTLGNPKFSQGYDSFTVNIKAVTFRDLVATHQLERIDFVKIDVEGAELLVLDGMTSFLKAKAIGCVIFEVNYLTLEGFSRTVSDLMSFWTAFDYQLLRLDSDGSPVPLSGEWPETLIGDCIALPTEKPINAH